MKKRNCHPKILLAHAFTMLVAFGVVPETLLAQNGLQITSPAGGSVVRPGQTITVTVSGPLGASFDTIAVLGDGPIGFSTTVGLSASPWQVALPIPGKMNPGVYYLTATGVPAAGEPVESQEVAIDVEREDDPVSVRIELTNLVSAIGDKDRMLVSAVFANGDKCDLGRSTKTTWISENPSIASVDNTGMITALAPGTTNVVVSSGTAQALVKVTVMPALRILPWTTHLYASQTQKFVAKGGYADTPSVTWSIDPPDAGTIDNTGLYAAPSAITSQKQVTIIATSTQDTTAVATAKVTLFGGMAVTVTPSSATINQGATLQLTGIATNAVNTGVRWSINPEGLGSIDASGLYTAPGSVATSQTATVTATSLADATKTANATITIAACAVDATAQFTIVRGASRLNSGTHRFTQTVTVTNTSGSALDGPFALVLDGLNPAISLYNPAGTTSCALPTGSPYAILDPGSNWQPGQVLTVLLQFVNPGNLGIAYTPRILSGTSR